MANILVVEDRPDTSNMIKIALEKAGHSVILAMDGEEGLRMTNERNVDVVILDIKMPKMDGKEVLRKVRENKDNANVKVIMLTAIKVTEEMVDEYKKLGANGFLLKPINIDAIRKEIENQLK